MCWQVFFVLPAAFFSLLEKSNMSMEKALKKLVKEGDLMASMWEDEWLDIVYPWEILQANRIILDSWDDSSISKSAVMESNVTIQGVVNIEEDVVIKAGAVLEGPCSIGKGTYIGNNSLIPELYLRWEQVLNRVWRGTKKLRGT